MTQGASGDAWAVFMRSRCCSIATCSRGSLCRDMERLLGVPLAERALDVLLERRAVRRFGPSGTVSSGCQPRTGDDGAERKERDHGPSSQSEPASERQLLEGVTGQLRLNSFGTVRSNERRARGVGASLIARRPRLAFILIISFTSCRLAAIRSSSISSVVRRCLEQLRCDCWDMRESQLLSIRERTDEHGMLTAMSELMESQLSSCLGVRCLLGVTRMPVLWLKADRAGDDDAFLDLDRDDGGRRGVPCPRNSLGQSGTDLSGASVSEPCLLNARCDKFLGRSAVKRFGACANVSFALLVFRPRTPRMGAPLSESASEQTLRAGVVQRLREGVVQRLRAGVVQRL